jgi:hypothetical protein
MNSNIKEKFITVFTITPDEPRINAVIKFLGEEKVELALDYLLMTGLRPPSEGRKENPYGLVYSIARWIKNYKFD